MTQVYSARVREKTIDNADYSRDLELKAESAELINRIYLHESQREVG